jgi:hypothetical protein
MGRIEPKPWSAARIAVKRSISTIYEDRIATLWRLL